MRLRGFRVWILFFLVGLFTAGSLRVWHAPSGAYRERQFQTLGVSMATHERLQREGWRHPIDAFLNPVELAREPESTRAYRWNGMIFL
jgi:hypothetical protein